MRCTLMYCCERGGRAAPCTSEHGFPRGRGRKVQFTMLNYMSYENYASISSSKKIQSEPRVHRHQSSITKKENARGKQDAVAMRKTEMVNIFT